MYAFFFLTICKTITTFYFQVNDLGNPKNKKGKDVPAHYEVCEACKLYLDINEDIPLPLLARLIKFKLLAIKSADLRRRETEKKVSRNFYFIFIRQTLFCLRGKNVMATASCLEAHVMSLLCGLHHFKSRRENVETNFCIIAYRNNFIG